MGVLRFFVAAVAVALASAGASRARRGARRARRSAPSTTSPSTPRIPRGSTRWSGTAASGAATTAARPGRCRRPTWSGGRWSGSRSIARTPSTLWAGEKNPGEPALWRSTRPRRHLEAGARQGGRASASTCTRSAIASPSRPPARPTSGCPRPTCTTAAATAARPGATSGCPTRTPTRSRSIRRTPTSSIGRPRRREVPLLAQRRRRQELEGDGRRPRGGDHGRWSSTAPGASTRSTAASGIWKSADRGETWSELPSPADGADDIWRLQVDPSNPKALWAATEDGLKKSVDGGATWSESDEGVGRYLVRARRVRSARLRARCAPPSRAPASSVRTTAARHWTASNGGLTGAWIDGLEGSPRNGTLFARASVGLYRRDAAGAWSEVQAPFADGKKADPGLFFDRRDARAASGPSTARSSGARPTTGGAGSEMKLKELKMRDIDEGQDRAGAVRELHAGPRRSAKVLYAGAWSSNEPGLAVSKSVDGGVNWKPAGQGLPGEAVDRLLARGARGGLRPRSTRRCYRTDDGAGLLAAARGLPGRAAAQAGDRSVVPRAPLRRDEGRALPLDRQRRELDAARGRNREGGRRGRGRRARRPGLRRPLPRRLREPRRRRDLDVGQRGIAQSRRPRAGDLRLSPLRLAAGTAGNGVFSIELP